MRCLVGRSLEKLDFDTLHYSYKIMCVHTCNDDVLMEYLFKNVLELLEKASEVSSELRAKLGNPYGYFFINALKNTGRSCSGK